MLPSGRFGDEGGLAAQTAAMYANVEHRFIPASDHLAFDDLPGEQWHFERPDLNLPNLNWGNRINSAAATAGVTAMLTGSMGNATISYLAPSRKRAAAERIVPRSLIRVVGRLRSREHDPLRVGVINKDARGLNEVLAHDDDPGRAGSVSERLHMIRRVDPGTLNKGTFLRWNIGLLDPTADRRLVEFCLRVPLRQYSYGNVSRALVRTALKGRAPDAVRWEMRRGMQSPHWFSMLSNSRNDARNLLDSISQSETAARLLDLGQMRRMLDRWPDSHLFGPPAYRHGFLRGLSVGEFIRRMDGHGRNVRCANPAAIS
jgi:asparagine synthase (glutamine-hydrolysing)